MILTKSGQPRLGAVFDLPTYGPRGADRFTVRVVGKLFGKGGSADLIGVIVEEAEGPTGRIELEWPLTRSDGTPIEVDAP